jgi:hypothetical protein
MSVSETPRKRGRLYASCVPGPDILMDRLKEPSAIFPEGNARPRAYDVALDPMLRHAEHQVPQVIEVGFIVHPTTGA